MQRGRMRQERERERWGKQRKRGEIARNKERKQESTGGERERERKKEARGDKEGEARQGKCIPLIDCSGRQGEDAMEKTKGIDGFSARRRYLLLDSDERKVMHGHDMMFEASVFY
jgi:hypothetical protein